MNKYFSVVTVSKTRILNVNFQPITLNGTVMVLPAVKCNSNSRNTESSFHKIIFNLSEWLKGWTEHNFTASVVGFHFVEWIVDAVLVEFEEQLISIVFELLVNF